MIVIATNNGMKYLPSLLASLELHGTGDHEVLVMDTGSSNPEFLTYLKEIGDREWPFKLAVDRTPFSGYDTGAYIHAYRTREADTYVFMQDSVLVKSAGWIHAFESRLTFNVGCVPWLVFPMQWDNQDQIDWIQAKYRTNQWPPFGIFGPIFCATKEALDMLDSRRYLEVIPSNKIEQQAMERGWATAFELSGLSVRPIETSFDEKLLFDDCYTHLTKRFAIRA